MFLRGGPTACSRRRVRIHVLSIALVLSPSVAFAADAGAPEAEIDELMKSITHDAETLSTDDCISACKALDSMRRATGRLCSLDAGRRCAEARAKLNDATRRVHAACPVCATPEESPSPGPGSASEPPRPMGKGGTHPTADAPQAAPPPQAERARGGCLGCGGGSSSDQGATAIVGALAFLFARRRPRRR
jgi:hypothetical protein